MKMIIVDLDATLLKSDKTISDYTVKIFNQCRKNGHMIVFATARSESECRTFSDIVSPWAIISNRGANVRVGDETIHRVTIDMQTSNDLLMSLVNHPSVGFITVRIEDGYRINIPEDKHNPAWGEYNPAAYTDFANGLVCETYKISAEIFDDIAASEILSAYSNINMVRFSGEDWYSFASKSVTKWEGIKALAAHVGISVENTIAFGDDFSDIEMLRECGVGVAVANAIDEVKAVADIVCDSNDNDGVAKWLEKNLL